MLCIDSMISSQEHDQQKLLQAAATSVQQGFIASDKENLLLSSII